MIIKGVALVFDINKTTKIAIKFIYYCMEFMLHLKI